MCGVSAGHLFFESLFLFCCFCRFTSPHRTDSITFELKSDAPAVIGADGKEVAAPGFRPSFPATEHKLENGLKFLIGRIEPDADRAAAPAPPAPAGGVITLPATTRKLRISVEVGEAPDKKFPFRVVGRWKYIGPAEAIPLLFATEVDVAEDARVIIFRMQNVADWTVGTYQLELDFAGAHTRTSEFELIVRCPLSAVRCPLCGG